MSNETIVTYLVHNIETLSVNHGVKHISRFSHLLCRWRYDKTIWVINVVVSFTGKLSALPCFNAMSRFISLIHLQAFKKDKKCLHYTGRIQVLVCINHTSQCPIHLTVLYNFIVQVNRYDLMGHVLFIKSIAAFIQCWISFVACVAHGLAVQIR